ncbi:hypothetical protein [Escherichia phage P818]|nr:hypothetical protein [Escherichia phage P818]
MKLYDVIKLLMTLLTLGLSLATLFLVIIFLVFVK